MLLILIVWFVCCARSARFAVQASLDLYSRILDVIERNNYDNFRKRAFTTKLEKLSILPSSFIRASSAGPRPQPRPATQRN